MKHPSHKSKGPTHSGVNDENDDDDGEEGNGSSVPSGYRLYQPVVSHTKLTHATDQQRREMRVGQADGFVHGPRLIVSSTDLGGMIGVKHGALLVRTVRVDGVQIPNGSGDVA